MNRRQLLQLSSGSVVFSLAGAHRMTPARATAVGHAPYDALLERYVQPYSDGVNRVDYAGWKASQGDMKALRDFVATLAARRPSAMPRNEALAYWANLYNALTLLVVLDRYPVKSIRDIKSDGLFDAKAYTGPWRTKRVTVEGKALSLDDIEHEKMRPIFKDPRMHYAVNCASIGCPNLLPKAWQAETLEADLDAAARGFINTRRGVEVIAGNKLRVSSIYKWFREDFGPDNAAVLAHLKMYAGPDLAKRLERVTDITEDQYDWALNGLTAAGQ